MLQQCPLEEIDMGSVKAWRLMHAWETGITPAAPAAYLEQTGSILDAIEYAQSERNRVQNAMQERELRRAEQGG